MFLSGSVLCTLLPCIHFILIILGIYSMRGVRHVVLDEADTLMDDSFNELVTHFLKRFHVCFKFLHFFYLV